MKLEERATEIRARIMTLKTTSQIAIERYQRRDRLNASDREAEVADQGNASNLESERVDFIIRHATIVQSCDAALERLEAGTYDQCKKCGDEIGENRHKSLPFAVTCTTCAAAKEAAEDSPRSRQFSLRPIRVVRAY